MLRALGSLVSLSSSTPKPQTRAPDEHDLLETTLQWKSVGAYLAPIQQGPTRILILGRAGCGKTYLVQTACSDNDRIDGNGSIEKTSTVSSHRVTLQASREQPFKLIDSPGFDNPAMSNLQVFSKLADYLSSGPRKYYGITGIIYIHRLGDVVGSRALAQNIRVISDLILGDSGLSRLTIMLVPNEQQPHPSTPLAQALSCESVFHQACDKGAKIVKSSMDVEDIDTILLSYTSCEPVLLRIQREHIHNPRFPIQGQIETALGYVDKELIQPRINRQIRQKTDPLINKIQNLEKTLTERGFQLQRSSNTCNSLEQQLARSRGETSTIRQQLQQTQSEYASLRSQLQLQENVEQSDVVQAMKDLNRDIEDIGRLVSAHLVDNFAEKGFDKDLGDLTALDARHLPELKILLGHAEGNSSLIASSDLVGMPIEDFLDYAIRSMLCGHLWGRIFRPFHPGVDILQNNTMASMYENIQKLEPQAVAGKWRVNSFKSIYKDENLDLTSQHINSITEDLVNNTLMPLVTYFFGEEVGAGVDKQHLDRFVRLVQAAWDWNSMLKQEVVMLGDFHQSFYAPLHPFDHELMDEFEPNSRFQPTSILGTIGLGLIVFRAIGGGRVPEKTVVIKAIVATGGLYA